MVKIVCFFFLAVSQILTITYRLKIVNAKDETVDVGVSVTWSFAVQSVVFFSSGISVVLFLTPGISRCNNRSLQKLSARVWIK